MKTKCTPVEIFVSAIKKILLPVFLWTMLLCYGISTYAQANKSLSNLTAPTAVNQSLLPNASVTFNLGSSTRTWNHLYLGGKIYNANSQIFSVSQFELFDNVAVGVDAATRDGVFIGNSAGNNSGSGLGNTAVGNYTFRSSTSGYNNTTIGAYSLFSNTTGYSNTAAGSESLYSNTTGFYNTANGYRSLYLNTNGSYNTANGYRSLNANQGGIGNAAVGYYSLYSNTTGSYNTAIGGRYALYRNTTGRYNTASGYDALYSNTVGGDNTANGSFSLYNNTSGTSNAAIGTNSLLTNTTGSFNTAIGYTADVSASNLTNATAIGNGALADASNKVRIGNTSVTSIGGQVGWTIFSDGRYKKDIRENIPGLAFINSLRPITYTVNVKGLNEYYNKERKTVAADEAASNEDNAAKAEMAKAEDAASKIVYNGFIAQEVEEAAKKLNFEFSGVDKPQNKDALYGLRYDNFIVPLVKAVQELSKQNEDLQQQINELKAMMNNGTKSNVTLHDISLEQNTPNPFSNNSSIRYNIPAGSKNAQLIVTDNTGKTVKQITLNTSKGFVNIDASSLSSGVYSYSLLIDGKMIETKKMVKAN